MRLWLTIILCLSSIAIAGTVSGPGRVIRLPSPSGAAPAYQPPGYAASTLWLDGSWTNSSGYIPDLSAQGTNYGYPLSGANQPTPTNFPDGNQCWYFDGGDAIMVTNEPMQISGYMYSNATWRIWARLTGVSSVYLTGYGDSAGTRSGFFYNGGLGVKYAGGNHFYGNFALTSGWVHIVLTISRSGTTATLNGWTNGVHAFTNKTQTVNNNGQDGVYIGRSSEATYPFVGYLDEHYVCTNYVWSGLEATNDWNATKATYGY